MKFYIISDSPEYSIVAANHINKSGNTAIMSENTSEDTRDILTELRDKAGSSFDMILVLCKGAKDVAISANKIGGVMAVACKDEDDAIEAAVDTRANVVVVDSYKSSRKALSDILDGLLSDEEELQKPSRAAARERDRDVRDEKEYAREREPVRDREPARDPAPSRMHMPSISLKGIAKKPQVKSLPGSGMVRDIKKKGMMKSLKETFGLDGESEKD